MLFSPNKPLTRGMIATILYRMANETDVSDLSNPFVDVTEGKWYAEAVKWAVENGIVSGYGNGKFGPEDNITRQDLAAVLFNYSNFIGMKLNEIRDYQYFSDSDHIADYAKKSVELLYRAGIVVGRLGNKFDPRGQATRAEMAAMLHRFSVEKE